MDWVLSPYHLTSRDSVASAALLLGSSCVTLVPVPTSGADRRSLEAAATLVPQYRELVGAWAWSKPLWDAGVLRADCRGATVSDEVRGILAMIEADGAFAPLRAMLNTLILNDDEAYLETLANDLLRSGADPGVTIPVAVALDAFGGRHGLVVGRPSAVSVVEKAEQRLADPVCSCAIPLLARGDADRVLEARDLLRGELSDLRQEMRPGGDVRGAAHAYTRAFELEREQLLRCDDPDEPPPMEVQATLTLASLPGDASLRACSAAARRFVGARGIPAGMPQAPARVLPDVYTMIVKPLGRPVALR